MNRPEPAPRDVVPPTPIDRRALRALDGREVTVTEPGEPIYSVDGEWIGMTPTTVTTALFIHPDLPPDAA